MVGRIASQRGSKDTDQLIVYFSEFKLGCIEVDSIELGAN
jgi:hypothetical protein